MSNFLSPMEENDNRSRYPDNLFLDTTREALEKSGLKVVSAADTSDDTYVLFISLGEEALARNENLPYNSIIIRVSPSGRLYASNEAGLQALKERLGIEN